MIRFNGQPWAPAVYTPPLTDGDFLSDGPRLNALLQRHWRTPDKQLIELDDWQQALNNHLLERYPLDWPVPALRGRLRFRQDVVSMGRQNGKSLIGGGLALYGLTQHTRLPSVVGVATSVDQANVVYSRVAFAVRNDKLLDKMMKASGTRGIKWRDGRGGYSVKPALAEGLQSVPVSLGIADELHLSQEEMWNSIVNGQRAQLDALLAGITTAGDESSTLLKKLYDRGRAAAADPASDPRFGFFLWEAPENPDWTNDDHLKAANPAVACGRVDLDTFRSDIRELPEPDKIRYSLNRFVLSSDSWVSLPVWDKQAGAELPDPAGPVVVGAAVTSRWDLTLAAAWRTDTGDILTELIGTWPRANLDQLKTLATQLADRHNAITWAMPAAPLGKAADRLKDDGHDVWKLHSNELTQASPAWWARVAAGTLHHDGHRLIRYQLPQTGRKITSPTEWRIVPGDAGADADAVIATLAACWVAEHVEPRTLQMW